jgi:DNA sulfur modification protein DndD
MKIISLVMNNFGPYRGQQEVAFPTDSSRRVMLVFGDNMRGKTSLLNAIRWVLYGKALDRTSREIELIHLVNRDAQDEDDFSLSVLLRFEADGIEYELSRSVQPFEMIGRPRTNAHFKQDVLLRKNGTVVRGEEIEQHINSFIPQQVSRFYLFDGELLDEYESLLREDTSQGQMIKEAIEQILGVPALINARNETKDLLKKAQTLQAKESKNVSALASYSAQSLQLQEQIAAHERDLEAEKDKLKKIVEQIDAIGSELSAAEPIQALNLELTTVRRQIANLESDIADYQKQRHEALRSAWRDLLQPRLSARREFLSQQIDRNRNQIKEEGALGDRIKRIDFLLKQSLCPTCEQEIGENLRVRLGSELGTLSAELQDITMNATAVNEATTELSLLNRILGTNAAQRIRRLETSIEKSSIQLTAHEGQAETLNEKLSNHDIAHIARLSKERDGLLKIRGKLDKNIEDLDAEISEKRGKVSQLARLMYKSPEARNQRSSREVEVYTGLEQIFSKSIDTLRDRLRSKVAQEATSVFKQLTTEDTYIGLRINSNYGLTILDRKGEDVAIRSAGAEQVVAMSLLSALNRTVNRPGPVVVDTPFGRLDPKHRQNILRYVPNMGEQIVFLVHEGEINRVTGLDAITPYIGRTYEIQRISSSHSEIVRVEE